MMEQLENDPWIRVIGSFQFFACIAAWIFLIGRWRRNGEVLSYELRRPVPWGPAGALLAIAFTAMTIAAALAPAEASQQVAALNAQEMTSRLLAQMVVDLCAPALLLFVALMSNAKRSDVGMPPFSSAAIARDFAIGVVVALAAIIPVRAVQIAVAYVLQLPEGLTKHPVVEMLLTGQTGVLVLVLTTIMAVVVAPICEEITFRLLLQGWLEKWEDRRLGWRRPPVDDARYDETADLPDDIATPQATSQEIANEPTPSGPEPPRRGVAGLPYGWTPIILSSLLFAAAHFGYGPEPVPLFVLALFLGYCYQRTHRILPCIVAHALFNLLSMVVLWRVVLLNSQ